MHGRGNEDVTAGGQVLREPPRWAARLAWGLWGLAMAGLAVVGAGGGGRAGGQPAVVVGAGSLVVRFRRARGTERQQLRWVALAA
ncbi:MAG: hypothetical protein K0S88_3946, partial [Actinomycetia bacterium]|nr:hypothetical protein [Actinomycetes bacterium]